MDTNKEHEMHGTIGRHVKDRVTGFAGVVVGRVEYLTGCTQILVQPPVPEDKQEMPTSVWLDEQRCAFDGADRIEIENGATPGADRPAPKR